MAACFIAFCEFIERVRDELCHTGAAESPEVKTIRVTLLFAWEHAKGERKWEKKCTLLFASVCASETTLVTIRSANLKRLRNPKCTQAEERKDGGEKME